MSLYQLTIEPGTIFFDLQAKGSLIVPDEDRATDMFELTQDLTEKRGLSAYEVSNHASEGQESRHNLLYWRYGEYAGVGPGAHARIAAGENRRAIVMEKHPETWRTNVGKQGHGIVEDSIVLPVDQASEYLIMGLRVSDGIDLTRYENLKGQPMDPTKIAGLKSMGLIKREGSRLMATRQGRRLLNALITELAQ
jgi:oxygen-independent coproporphyrinogen-3 oxidase